MAHSLKPIQILDQCHPADALHGKVEVNTQSKSQPKMGGQEQAGGDECAKQGSTGVEQTHGIVVQQCQTRPIWGRVGS